MAEKVWSPSSAISPLIEWEGIYSLLAKVIINYKRTVANGIFYFNEKGNFIKSQPYVIKIISQKQSVIHG
ncbi:MAG: DUF6544 family protein [Bacteroidales bacterium]